LTGVVFISWHMGLTLYYGSSINGDQLFSVQASAQEAALLFSFDLIDANLRELLSRAAYLGALLPSLIYGFSLAIPRNREGQVWAILLIMVVTNLSWFVLASVGWLRYAFIGLALGGLFIARFFSDLTGGFRIGKTDRWNRYLNGILSPAQQTLRVALIIWLSIIIAAPLGKTIWEMMNQRQNDAMEIAQYLSENIPFDSTIETWEPELGFLTDHDYHFPPNSMLNKAIAFVWFDQPPVSEFYDYKKSGNPSYVVVGEFGNWTGIYPAESLDREYSLLHTVGDYRLFELDEAH
jgi:hypothetical protein